MRILEDDLSSPAITKLLREHLDDMHATTPLESVHALDLESLREPDITFWSVWDDQSLLGCGALKELDSESAEIKSMRTVEAHRGRRVASRLLEHLLDVASRRGYACLYLETGAMAEFEAARNLYAKYGFVERGPFGSYVEDPHSVFMERRLGSEF